MHKLLQSQTEFITLQKLKKRKKGRHHLHILLLVEGQKSFSEFTYVNSPKERQTLEKSNSCRLTQKTTSIVKTNNSYSSIHICNDLD